MVITGNNPLFERPKNVVLTQCHLYHPNFPTIFFSQKGHHDGFFLMDCYGWETKKSTYLDGKSNRAR